MSARAVRVARFGARVVVAMVCVAAPGLAAPPDPGAPLDQYDAFDRLSPTVRDAKTQLEWSRSVIPSRVHAEAASVCSSRAELPPGRRVPTVKELLTLVDENPHQVYENGGIVQKAIDPGAFSSVTYTTPTNAPYWTSTPAGPGEVWTVDFTTGETAPRSTTLLGNVRCVFSP